MSNTYTGMWQFQPYVSWKRGSASSVMAGWSRPNVNGPSANPNDYSGPARKARPLKIWRKQLQPTANSGNSAASISVAQRPGGTVARGGTCRCVDNGNLFIRDLSLNPQVIQTPSAGDKIQNNGVVHVGAGDLSYNIQTGIYNTTCVACNPENNVIKSAVTLLSKAYYSDTRAYLQARCKTHDIKATLSAAPNVAYIGADGKALYPTDSATGPQVFSTNCCAEVGQGCTGSTIYKPNNRPFAQQGAVSGSTRLAKLKYDTITKNGQSFRSAAYYAQFQQVSSAGDYHGTPEAPFFLKSKNQVCSNTIYHKNGQPTSCFKTPVASMQQQMPTTTLIYTR